MMGVQSPFIDSCISLALPVRCSLDFCYATGILNNGIRYWQSKENFHETFKKLNLPLFIIKTWKCAEICSLNMNFCGLFLNFSGKWNVKSLTLTILGSLTLYSLVEG